MTWATDLLEKMKMGTHQPPPLVETLKLGLLDDWREGWVKKRWRLQPELLHPDDSMFGGYMAALFDQTFAFVAMSVLADDEAVRTLSLNVSFVSLSRNEDVIIEARLVSRSRRLMTIDGTLSSPDGRVRSVATCQQMIIKRAAS